MKTLRLTLAATLIALLPAAAEAVLATRTLMPEFIGTHEWANTVFPLTRADLEGNVVLIVFFNHGSLDSYRDLQIANRWFKKYGQRGLTVIGIHSPEFDFEKNSKAEAAAKTWRIQFPIAMDPELDLWLAYNTHVRPTHFIIDAENLVRGVFQGRGSYREQEKMIQDLLRESGRRLRLKIHAQDKSPEAAAQAASRPIKMGSRTMSSLGNPGKIRAGTQTYEIPPDLKTEFFYLSGLWTLEEQYLESAGPQSAAVILFRGRKIYATLGHQGEGEAEVLLNGKPLTTANRGGNVDLKNGKSYLVLKGGGLYSVLNERTPAEGKLEIIFGPAPARVYTVFFE